MDNSEADYTFTVAATNKAGTSADQRPVRRRPRRRQTGHGGQPSATLEDTGGDGGKIDVTFTAADRRPAQRLQRRRDHLQVQAHIRRRQRHHPGRRRTSVAAPNGDRHRRRGLAVSSRSSSSGDASPPRIR